MSRSSESASTPASEKCSWRRRAPPPRTRSPSRTSSTWWVLLHTRARVNLWMKFGCALIKAERCGARRNVWVVIMIKQVCLIRPLRRWWLTCDEVEFNSPVAPTTPGAPVRKKSFSHTQCQCRSKWEEDGSSRRIYQKKKRMRRGGRGLFGARPERTSCAHEKGTAESSALRREPLRRTRCSVKRYAAWNWALIYLISHSRASRAPSVIKVASSPRHRRFFLLQVFRAALCSLMRVRRTVSRS